MADINNTIQGRHAIRVLIVEDHRDTAEMLGMALRVLGYHVAIANTGMEGLSLLEEWQPDVAIVDFLMPDIDGIEMARQARARKPDRRVPLIALTGYEDRKMWEEAQAAGFDAYLMKPADTINLMKVIESVCPGSLPSSG